MPAISVIPIPRSVILNGGTCDVSRARIVVNRDDYPLLCDVATLLNDELQELGLPSMKVELDDADSLPNTIVLSLREPKMDGDESYELTVDTGVSLTGGTATGVYYASRTLLQMIVSHGTSLPCCDLSDEPTYPKRMMLLDVARKFFTFEEVLDVIRIMGWFKMNELHLHLNDDSRGGYAAYRVESLTFPEITSKDGYYTQEQIRTMQDFGDLHGVTIIPEIDSPGHASCFTKVFPEIKRSGLPDNYVDVTNPETFRIMQRVFDEIIDLFDSEDIHIGTDEYRMGGCSDEEKELLGEAFRRYINHFSRYLKSKGRRARIWSGYEFMKGTTEPDKDIVIDMWETTDAKSKIDAGYDVINSSHFYTYVVPGAPYYGVDDRFIYEEWTPRVFKKSAKETVLDVDETAAQADLGVLDSDHPRLLGGKLHVWNDFGPEGYTTTEIARLILESMPGFSEKVWGTRTTEKYEDFKPLAEGLTTIPRTTISNRVHADANGVIYDSGDVEFEFDSDDSNVPLPWAGSRANLEYPWTVSLEIRPTASPDSPQVFLGSRICEFYLNLTHERKEGRGDDEKTITTTGIGVERADHYRKEALRGTPSGHRTLHTFDCHLPLNEWSHLRITGDRRICTLTVNGAIIGEAKVQMLCPLEYLGGGRGHSFIGTMRNVLIHDGIRD